MKSIVAKHSLAISGVLVIIGMLLDFVTLIVETYIGPEHWSYSLQYVINNFLGPGLVKAVYYAVFAIAVILIAVNYFLGVSFKKYVTLFVSSLGILLVAFEYLKVLQFAKNSGYKTVIPGTGMILALVGFISGIVFSLGFVDDSGIVNFNAIKEKGSAVASKAAEVAGNAGSEVIEATKEQSELLGLKSEVNVIDKEIEASQLMIGKKYVDYVIESGEMPGIDVYDILHLMEPKLERKQELNDRLIELEKRIKNEKILREKQAAEKEFFEQKEKLDKALAMEILDKEEYEKRIDALKKKLDNFEVIRKLDQQVQMGLITEEEKNAKLYDILN